VTSAARLVALAIRNDEFQDGRILDPVAIAALRESLQPVALPWVAVRQRAHERGLTLLTADQVARQDGGGDLRSVRVIAYDWSPAAQALLAQGARPALLTTLEPPVIAWSFYATLPTTSRRFPHALVFAGARARLAPGCLFHELRYPLAPVAGPGAPRPWLDRPGYLVMVNSNKAIVRALARLFDRPRELSFKRLLAGYRYPPIRAELYGERLRAILFFARRPDFDLYGEGWERRHPAVGPAQHAAALAAYRGPARDKLATLAGYRFALTFENARFPGYVSEKLFDALRAGCIPVYDGAPDVDRYVPPEAFVDARRFASYAILDAFLRAMPRSTAEQYLEAGKAYLASAAYESFSAAAFARQIVAAVESVPV